MEHLVVNVEAQTVTRVELTGREVAWREENAKAVGWVRLREDRDALLQASDWTQSPDTPVDREAWAKYRQELRDLPADTKDAQTVEWPVPPEPSA